MKLDDIIVGCKNGDSKCQTRLVKSYAPVLLSICRRYTRDSETANDALQETFINIFKYIGGYKGTGSFEGWMKRIAANCSMTFQKKHFKVHYEMDELHDTSKHSEIPDIYSKMGKDDILKLLEHLPPALYNVFNLHVVEGFSHKEISEMLDISEGTSRGSLSRARTKLIAIMNEKKATENLRLEAFRIPKIV